MGLAAALVQVCTCSSAFRLGRDRSSPAVPRLDCISLVSESAALQSVCKSTAHRRERLLCEGRMRDKSLLQLLGSYLLTSQPKGTATVHVGKINPLSFLRAGAAGLTCLIRRHSVCAHLPTRGALSHWLPLCCKCLHTKSIASPTCHQKKKKICSCFFKEGLNLFYFNNLSPSRNLTVFVNTESKCSPKSHLT